MTMVESFWKGLNTAHMIENNKQVQARLQQQAQLQRMQMTKMAQDMMVNQRKLETPTELEMFRKNPEEYKQFKQAGKAVPVPKTNISPTELDAIAAGMITHPLYSQKDANKLRKARMETTMQTARATATGKVEGVVSQKDAENKAWMVLKGYETFDNFRNVFGVSVQEQIRTEIHKIDPEYDYVTRRVSYEGLMNSAKAQEKRRGGMGSFVTNINDQVGKVEAMYKDVIDRVGVRALDVPWRELNVRFRGSGQERVLEAYMKEISAEIDKLSQGSAESIAQLSVESRKAWERIHDVNLPLREIKKVLVGTRDMANIRLRSVDNELKRTMGQLKTRGVSEKYLPKKKETAPDLTTMSDEELMMELSK